jgi:glutamate carboxypeptidase
LGAIGDGAHAAHEYLILDALAPRAALVAGLLHRLGRL